MRTSLHARLHALEQAQPSANRPSVFVRLVSRQGETPHALAGRMAEARAAYTADHGEPRGGVGVILRTLVSPKHQEPCNA